MSLDLPLSTASASKRLANNLRLHDEIHENDQGEDSNKPYISLVLLIRDVFTFRKVLLVVVERLGWLFPNGGHLAELFSCLLYLLWRSGQNSRHRGADKSLKPFPNMVSPFICFEVFFFCFRFRSC